MFFVADAVDFGQQRSHLVRVGVKVLFLCEFQGLLADLFRHPAAGLLFDGMHQPLSIVQLPGMGSIRALGQSANPIGGFVEVFPVAIR